MGQGNYLSVVYGVALADEALRKSLETKDGDWAWDDMTIPRNERLAWADEPSTAYEANVPYVGFRVAASNGMAGDDIADLDDIGCMRLADLPAAIEAKASKAKAQWAKFAAWMSARGYSLPTPELIWVADYD